MLPLLGLVCLCVLSSSATSVSDNEVVPRRINNGEELLEAIVGDCFTGDGEKGVSSMSCLRLKVLSYLDTLAGAEARALEDSDAENLDAVILSRVTRYLKTHQFKLHLPEFLFQEAVLTFRPGKSLADFKVSFPKQDASEDRAIKEARGLLKKKLLLPLLLLVKLKMKALMPIFVAIIGVKALKALVLSKIAILLVGGFLIMQLCKKMPMMPMMPMLTVEPAAPTPYGAPASGPSTPSSTYDPGWDPTGSSSGGPYSRVYDPHQMAYSSYYSQQQQSSQQSPQSSKSS